MRKEIIENLKVKDFEKLLSEKMEDKVLCYFDNLETALYAYKEGARNDDNNYNVTYLNAEKYFEEYFDNVYDLNFLVKSRLINVKNCDMFLNQLDDYIKMAIGTDEGIDFTKFTEFKNAGYTHTYIFSNIDDEINHKIKVYFKPYVNDWDEEDFASLGGKLVDFDFE